MHLSPSRGVQLPHRSQWAQLPYTENIEALCFDLVVKKSGKFQATINKTKMTAVHAHSVDWLYLYLFIVGLPEPLTRDVEHSVPRFFRVLSQDKLG